MNKKGFMMAELIVVSSIVLVTLVGLYTSYNKIFSVYRERINYYDVGVLYKLSYIRNNIDFEVAVPNINNPVFEDVGEEIWEKVYYINKNDIVKVNAVNITFKNYLTYLDSSLDFDEMYDKYGDVTNILVMEKCEPDGVTDCRYAYLEVLDNEETE